jgi:tetratricopeptide (TPR) repeat protein
MDDIDYVSRDMRDTVRDWRGNSIKLVTVVPTLEQMIEQLRYKNAWVKLYRGMALPDDEERRMERRNLLSDAVVSVETYTQGANEFGVKYNALLLSGMATRELGAWPQALKYYEQALVQQAPAAVQLQARFEIARTLAEQAAASETPDFIASLKALDDFRRVAPQLVGESNHRAVDAQAAFLENHIYELAASSTTDKEQAAQYDLQAQQALLAFLDKYPQQDVQNAFYDMIATKYRDRTDYENLNSVILLAVARSEVASGKAAGLSKANDLLQMVIKREDTISEKARPLALWELGMLNNRLRRNDQSAEHFMRLASEFPKHSLAPIAARNAVISYKAVIDERSRQNEIIPVKRREMFIEALNTLLGKWGDKDDNAEWYAELGWQHSELADVAGDEQGSEHLAKAADAFERVPADSPGATEARFQALAARARLVELKNLSADQRRVEANRIAGELHAYASKVRPLAQQAQDPGEAKTLREWGAQAEFIRARLLYEQMDQRRLAMEALEQLPQRWPNTSVLVAAQQMRIQKLIEESGEAGQSAKLDRAIEMVNKFRDDHPAEAEALMSLTVNEIRQRIDQLRLAGRDADARKYGEAYLKFAKVLYDKAASEKVEAEKMYGIQQMYADALLAAGNAEDAIKLFEQCRQINERRREQRLEQVSQRYKALISQCREASTNLTRLQGLAKQYFERLKALGIDKASVGPAMNVEIALQQLSKVQQDNPQAQPEAMSLLSRVLVEAYEHLQGIEKNSIPTDATNLHGLARAKAQMGNHAESLELYKQLLGGLNASRHAALYWRLQLEQAETIVAGFADDARSMRRLAYRIVQLREQDRQMGGLFERFEAVRTQASKLAE